MREPKMNEEKLQRLENIFYEIKAKFGQMDKDMVLVSRNQNLSANARARKASIELRGMLKSFRALSTAAEVIE